MKKLLYTILVSCAFASCGSEPATSVQNMPKWAVNQPELCGLGIYKLRNNLGAAKHFAIARGRVDLSGQIETKVKSMIKDYQASGEESSKDMTEELTRLASVNLSKTTINGSIPSKIDIVDDKVFTLVCLKPNILTDAIKNMNILSNEQTKALMRRSKIAHDELKLQMESYKD